MCRRRNPPRGNTYLAVLRGDRRTVPNQAGQVFSWLGDMWSHKEFKSQNPSITAEVDCIPEVREHHKVFGGATNDRLSVRHSLLINLVASIVLYGLAFSLIVAAIHAVELIAHRL